MVYQWRPLRILSAYTRLLGLVFGDQHRRSEGVRDDNYVEPYCCIMGVWLTSWRRQPQWVWQKYHYTRIATAWAKVLYFPGEER